VRFRKNWGGDLDALREKKAPSILVPRLGLGVRRMQALHGRRARDLAQRRHLLGRGCHKWKSELEAAVGYRVFAEHDAAVLESIANCVWAVKRGALKDSERHSVEILNPDEAEVKNLGFAGKLETGKGRR